MIKKAATYLSLDGNGKVFEQWGHGWDVRERFCAHEPAGSRPGRWWVRVIRPRGPLLGELPLSLSAVVGEVAAVMGGGSDGRIPVPVVVVVVVDPPEREWNWRVLPSDPRNSDSLRTGGSDSDSDSDSGGGGAGREKDGVPATRCTDEEEEEDVVVVRVAVPTTASGGGFPTLSLLATTATGFQTSSWV